MKKFRRDFCFVIKITNCRSACTTRDKSVAKIFDWGTKSQVMTSSENFKSGTFCGTKILKIRKSEAMACVFARNQGFAIGRELKSKIKSAKV